MTHEILERKQLINGKFDMLSNVCIIDYSKISIDDWIRIDESTIMGLDVIAEAMYGSNDYVWVLLKFNRLNMFELNVGDVIAIPNLDDFREHTKFINYKVRTSSKQIVQSTPSQKQIATKNYNKLSNGNVIF